MIKAVIWDNDGVLVVTEGLYFKATLEVLSEIGVDLIIEFFFHQGHPRIIGGISGRPNFLGRFAMGA